MKFRNDAYTCNLLAVDASANLNETAKDVRASNSRRILRYCLGFEECLNDDGDKAVEHVNVHRCRAGRRQIQTDCDCAFWRGLSRLVSAASACDIFGKSAGTKDSLSK